AGADPAQELLRPGDAPRPDRRGQAVRARVGKRERLVEAAGAVERRDRPEQLGAGQLRVGRNALDEGRADVEAPVVARAGEALAAGENGRAGAPRTLDRREHPVELALVDHGPEVVLVARPDPLRGRAFEQQLPEALVDGLEDDDAAAGGAALPGVREGG